MHRDHRIGRILAQLGEPGIGGDAMVLFTSDNGRAGESNSGPCKGGKTDLHEAGIRVPGMVCWPARIAGGGALKGLGRHGDIRPALCAAAAVPLPENRPCGEVILLDALAEGQAAPERGVVFWQHELFPRIQRHDPRPKPYATEVGSLKTGVEERPAGGAVRCRG